MPGVEESLDVGVAAIGMRPRLLSREMLKAGAEMRIQPAIQQRVRLLDQLALEIRD
jgi:hypothetical protein